MSWRHVMITKNSKLTTKYHQLVIEQDEKISIPLQDISSILIESPSVNLSSRLLSLCAQYDVAIFTCDEKYMPNGIWSSFHQHSRQLRVLTMQMGLKKPFEKRIWQKIIIRKIHNQAECLKLLKRTGVKDIEAIAKKVESGDVTNREAYAARLYFKCLFDGPFSRRSEDPVNRLLNYGYSIMRGVVARALVHYGFHPCLGIHHGNQLNPYNLADDFMEVYRPLVDYYVALLENKEEWNTQSRAGLVNLLSHEVRLNNNSLSVTVATEEMVKSFVTCCNNQDVSALKLPELLPLRVHAYE